MLVRTMSAVVELLTRMDVGECGLRWVSLPSEMSEARPLATAFWSLYLKSLRCALKSPIMCWFSVSQELKDFRFVYIWSM